MGLMDAISTLGSYTPVGMLYNAVFGKKSVEDQAEDVYDEGKEFLDEVAGSDPAVKAQTLLHMQQAVQKKLSELDPSLLRAAEYAGSLSPDGITNMESLLRLRNHQYS